MDGNTWITGTGPGGEMMYACYIDDGYPLMTKGIKTLWILLLAVKQATRVKLNLLVIRLVVISWFDKSWKIIIIWVVTIGNGRSSSSGSSPLVMEEMWRGFDVNVVKTLARA
ncbi:hypothetical protein QCA50_011613 [Cerrena zonata]|uniref:Uncharacterized protein n=1 Tax=Cerrena zonata TaxID=2478898 RepID=A0AAW0G292_9APHY